MDPKDIDKIADAISAKVVDKLKLANVTPQSDRFQEEHRLPNGQPTAQIQPGSQR